MRFPTIEQVEAANAVDLGRWLRFLPSPGLSAIPADPPEGEVLPDGWQDLVEQVRLAELAILNRIIARHEALGGWTPETSKAVGWGRP